MQTEQSRTKNSWWDWLSRHFTEELSALCRYQYADTLPGFRSIAHGMDGWYSQFGWNFSLSELYPNQVGVSAKILQPNMSSESLPGAPLTKGARATLHLGRDKERWNKGGRGR